MKNELDEYETGVMHLQATMRFTSEFDALRRVELTLSDSASRDDPSKVRIVL
jgi:hypothetical protein